MNCFIIHYANGPFTGWSDVIADSAEAARAKFHENWSSAVIKKVEEFDQFLAVVAR